MEVTNVISITSAFIPLFVVGYGIRGCVHPSAKWYRKYRAKYSFLLFSSTCSSGFHFHGNLLDNTSVCFFHFSIGIQSLRLCRDGRDRKRQSQLFFQRRINRSIRRINLTVDRTNQTCSTRPVHQRRNGNNRCPPGNILLAWPLPHWRIAARGRRVKKNRFSIQVNLQSYPDRAWSSGAVRGRGRKSTWRRRRCWKWKGFMRTFYSPQHSKSEWDKNMRLNWMLSMTGLINTI